MSTIGSNLPVRAYSVVPQGLEAQVTQAVQADPALADPTLQLLRGVSAFDAGGASVAPASTSGGITSPQDELLRGGTQLVQRYGERVTLGEETETIRSTVNQNTAAKKGAAPQTRTPDQTVRIPPAQVENRLRTDANFRQQLEQRLGGRIILDDTADGNITVERTRPVDSQMLNAAAAEQARNAAAAGFAAGAATSLLPAIAAAGVAARLEGIGRRLGTVLDSLGGAAASAGQQLQRTDAADASWPSQLAGSFELSLRGQFGGNDVPAGAFGGLSGWDQGFLSSFGDRADTASSQFVDATVRFGGVLDNTVDVFNSAQLGLQRAQRSGSGA